VAGAEDMIGKGRELTKAGDLDRALDLFVQAASSCRERGDVAGQIEALQLVAEIRLLRKESAGVLETYERMLALFKGMEDREGQGRVLNNIGLLQARSDRCEEALGCFKAALGIFEELGKPLRAAEQWGNIGSVYRDMKRYEEALQSYEHALPLFEKVDHREGVADQYTNIAYIHVMNNRLEEACTWYRRALPLYEEAGAEGKAGFTRQNLENLERSTG
jgi:tetratricopeptide (TPR) repeat protein